MVVHFVVGQMVATLATQLQPHGHAQIHHVGLEHPIFDAAVAFEYIKIGFSAVFKLHLHVVIAGFFKQAFQSDALEMAVFGSKGIIVGFLTDIEES